MYGKEIIECYRAEINVFSYELVKKKMGILQTEGPLSTITNDISPMGEIEQSPTKSGFTEICVNNYFMGIALLVVFH
jgi:hypothetical protein